VMRSRMVGNSLGRSSRSDSDQCKSNDATKSSELHRYVS
jgi:hypothetical protein